VVTVAFAATTLASPAAARTNQIVLPNEEVGIFVSALNPAAPPPGVNNYSCVLTAAHPQPIVLIPGTFGNMTDDYGALAPVLVNDGYCVFATNFGGTPGQLIQATGPMTTSAQQVATFIDQVSAAYHGTQVDLIGHSQGATLAEYAVKLLGEAPKVRNIVGLSPTTHGTTLSGLATLAGAIPGALTLVGTACPACQDQVAGSTVITALDRGPIAQPGVKYTIIETKNEEVVTPVGSTFIDEPGVVNEYVQSSCPADTVDHGDLSYDNTTIRLTLNALSPSTAVAPTCLQTFPYPAVQQ
jgi:pimeloyl-ACP methyl ester carboxylesterase